MPIYEYICIECGEKMEIWATIAEKEKGLNVTCQKCGSKKVAQVFSSFLIGGSSSGKDISSGCGPQFRPGCCG